MTNDEYARQLETFEQRLRMCALQAESQREPRPSPWPERFGVLVCVAIGALIVAMIWTYQP